ncbi:MAG: hypothetical protein WC802_05515 [Patescibacteria group bacterium]|jgi:hypothetical protein
MRLYVCGNDIERITLGILEKHGDGFTFSVPPTDIPGMTENYLGIIAGFLQAHEAPLDRLEGIVVASGEGSATALRSSHAIVNALGFARGLPLYAVRRRAGEPHEAILDKMPDHPITIALPEYANAPQISVTKKDALKRRT